MKYIKKYNESKNILYTKINYDQFTEYLNDRHIIFTEENKDILRHKLSGNWNLISITHAPHPDSGVMIVSSTVPLDVTIYQTDDDYFLFCSEFHFDNGIDDDYWRCDTMEGVLQLIKRHNII